MLPALTHPIVSGTVRLLTVPIVIVLAAGCAGSSPSTPPHVPAAAPPTKPDAVDTIPVVRNGRYTLVEVRPEEGQQDLLEQIIDVSLPPAVDTTVGDALRVVLQGTGYRLCEADSAAHMLHALPLPAVHLNLGPLTLREALSTLAGSAWTLGIDVAARCVCFTGNDELDAANETPATESGRHE